MADVSTARADKPPFVALDDPHDRPAALHRHSAELADPYFPNPMRANPRRSHQKPAGKKASCRRPMTTPTSPPSMMIVRLIPVALSDSRECAPSRWPVRARAIAAPSSLRPAPTSATITRLRSMETSPSGR